MLGLLLSSCALVLPALASRRFAGVFVSPQDADGQTSLVVRRAAAVGCDSRPSSCLYRQVSSADFPNGRS